MLDLFQTVYTAGRRSDAAGAARRARPPRLASDGWILLLMVFASEKEGTGIRDGWTGGKWQEAAGSTCAREKGGGRAGEYSFDMREQAEAKARLQL